METDKLRRQVVQQLESLQRSGVQQIPLATESDGELPLETEMSGKAAPSESPSGKSVELEVITAEVAQCTLCDELASTRNKTVFGSGNPDARLCFMGEAPGADEDRQGLPFVGRAGKLLTTIIEACRWTRDDVYILNTIKCRPPGNRNPSSTETANCRTFLDRQLAIIEPDFICCLGAVAIQNLLGTNEAIGKLRGRFHNYQGIKVLATYHPAYLLRNPSAKKACWDDMKLLLTEMGIPIPIGKTK